MTKHHAQTSTILAGPMLRRVDNQSVSVWLVSTSRLEMSIQLRKHGIDEAQSGTTKQRRIQIGTSAFISLLTLSTDEELVHNTRYEYDIITNDESILSGLSGLTYGELPCHFYYKQKLSNVMHGSCRKPHYEGGDALVALDANIAENLNHEKETRPDLLAFTGDQVYTDDVAAPMLQAIHQVIDTYGLYNEQLEGATVEDAKALMHKTELLYDREKLLPKVEVNETLLDTFFGAKEKPVFTSVHAKNHLISLSEMMAMYLLVWSPECWQNITFDNALTDPKLKQKFEDELKALEKFKNGLEHVRRVLAHIPTYMIFDDHDITDDWNLTRGWEEIVYNHPLSKRVIGNALTAYWLFQGWANDPDKFDSIYNQAQTVFEPELPQIDSLIDSLFDWQQWCFSLNTDPMVYVMDSRTQRWRSESDKNKPSGLLDWEALCDFQNTILGQSRLILISPAPIFGVKLIEAIQKTFTFFGHALTVDAENWMAHKGTANVILNIFRHTSTPPQFIILSGDVHYNFVYDVSIKHSKHSPRIVQFTSSGIKNEFPAKLLAVLDKINQVLYASRSPLNWFTKRRTMKIKARHPDNQPLRTLLNTPALGRVKFNDDNDAVVCELITAQGDTVTFNKDKHE